MKKRGRAKSIARWTAWVLAVLLPAMWVTGLFITVLVRSPKYSGGHFMAFGLGDGCIVLAHTVGPSRASTTHPILETLSARPIRLPRLWLPDIVKSPAGVQIVVPLWLPWLVALGFSAWFYRDHRREKQRCQNGCCPSCGYSRAGLAPDVPCPECGSLPTPGASR
ncbi:MAG: hypothetical protein IT434_05635 [Phycisphaerales bacterium]|jgi:hypothetical protein|nr:hypothetical protein [Phycisphaerales bacterium]